MGSHMVYMSDTIKIVPSRCAINWVKIEEHLVKQKFKYHSGYSMATMPYCTYIGGSRI